MIKTNAHQVSMADKLKIGRETSHVQSHVWPDSTQELP